MPAIQIVARIVIIGGSENRCFHITFTCVNGGVAQTKSAVVVHTLNFLITVA